MQVLIQPQPPLEPPPGMQLKPGDQGGMQEDPASITPVLPAAEGVIPPSQRAVLIDPPAGPSSVLLLCLADWRGARRGGKNHSSPLERIC